MGVFSDWKFYLFVIGGFNALITSIAFLTIKFNDLRHLGIDVSKIEKNVNKIEGKVNKIDKSVAVQKQRIDAVEKAIS